MKRFSLGILLISIIAFAFSQCESPALQGAKVYLRQGQPEKAKEQLLLEIQANPANAEAHYLVGRIYYDEGDYVNMKKYFDNSIEISPKYERSINQTINRAFSENYNVGLRFLKTSNAETDEEKRNQLWNQSIEKMETALVRREDKMAYEGMGVAYLQLGQKDKAEEFFNKTLSLDPQNKQSLINMGIMKFNMAVENDDDLNFYKESVHYFEEFIKYYPQERYNAIELGLAYEKLGETEKANEFYENVLKEQPNNIDIMIQLGVVKFNSGDQDSALELFKKALEIEPDNIVALKNISFPLFYRVYDKISTSTDTKEDWNMILPYMEKVAKLDPKDGDAWFALSIIYIKLDMREKAEEAAKKADAIKKGKF